MPAATGASLAATAQQVAATDPDVVVVVADDATGPRLVSQIDADLAGGRTRFVVNDAIRRPAATAQPFGQELAARVEGVSPLAYSSSETFLDALRAIDADATGLYAHNAYDCVNLVALAAQATGSLQPAEVAATVEQVSSGGTVCNAFPQCADALAEGLNIDYQGPSGELWIGPAGDPVSTVFDRFGFDESGRDVSRGTLVVTLG